MVPLYLAQIEDLGPGDFVKIDCAACSYTALISTTFLSRLGLSPRGKVLDIKGRARCQAGGVRGRAGVSIQMGRSVEKRDRHSVLSSTWTTWRWFRAPHHPRVQ